MRRATPMTPRKRAAALLLATLLSGCVVGPNYVAPKTELTAFHNVNAVTRRQTTAAAPQLDRWWTGFNDQVLVTIVQRALDQNLDLAAALARVEQARAGASAAGAKLLPTIDLDASASAERQSGEALLGSLGGKVPGYNRDQREYTLGPAASWELDLFGGLRRGANAARDEAQAAEADHVGTRITVAADAADAYFQIRGYQARLAVAQDQVDTDARLLSLVQDRYRAGQAEGREIAQAESLLRQARATLPPLRIALETQLNRLDVLMGVQPGTYAKQLAKPAEIPAIPAIGGADGTARCTQAPTRRHRGRATARRLERADR